MTPRVRKLERLACGAALAGVMAIARPASAAPEEIQVYQDELLAPGQAGLDLHLNTVATGSPEADAAGETSALHRLRLTPEFALGLSRTLEAGLYLPLAQMDGAGRFSADGVKARLKFIAPHAPNAGWYWGANFEIGRVNHRLDVNPWNAEFKAILGRHAGPWSFAVNANLDFKVAGPAPAPAELEIAARAVREVGQGWALGAETYDGLGPIKALGSASDHAAYAVVTKSLGKWDIDLGVGHGFGTNRDGLVVRMIVGVPIG